MSQDKKYRKFQFYSDWQVPVFIELEDYEWSINWDEILKTNNFNEIEESVDASQAGKATTTSGAAVKRSNLKRRIFRDKSKKLEKGRAVRPDEIKLRIVPASPYVATYIGNSQESDHFGLESVRPERNHYLYRYKGTAVLLFSYKHWDWELALSDHFNRTDYDQTTLSLILNRFLALALIEYGIFGFWGSVFQNGLLVQDNRNAHGHCVFFNLNKKEYLFQGQSKKWNSYFTFWRQDQCISNNQNLKMSTEETYSFLLNRLTYFHFQGLHPKLSQLVLYISKMFMGKRTSSQLSERQNLSY